MRAGPSGSAANEGGQGERSGFADCVLERAEKGVSRGWSVGATLATDAPLFCQS